MGRCSAHACGAQPRVAGTPAERRRPPLPDCWKLGEHVHRGQADQAVDEPAGHAGLAEVQTEHGRDQVEPGDGDEPPVQPTTSSTPATTSSFSICPTSV